MTWFQASFSFFYSLGQITLGLLLHPYQTMQMLVEDKVFVWMSLLPTGVLAVATILWRYFLVPFVQIIFSCSKSDFIGCEYISFSSNWLTFFVIYWQVMLLYLLFRFKQVFQN